MEQKVELSEEFSLKLSGNGVTIERQVSPSIASAIMNLVLGGQTATKGASVAEAGNDAEIDVPLSLREYLDKVEASRKTDQIVAIGHYMSVFEKQATFSKDDVKVRFATAREPMPSNFHRDFNLAIKSGMIAVTHQMAGHFYITKTGIQAVERTFSSAKNK